MKIVQISAVVEYHDTGNEDAGTWKRIPYEDATVYGLGDDGKMYYYGAVKTTRVELDEPDEEGETHRLDTEYGWKPYGG